MTPARLWYGTDRIARGARGALLPAEAAYRAVIGVRNALYDAGWLRAHSPALPALSVGNLSAGGTGKTPVAAHIARALADAGARPAVLLRGYGADEPVVHTILNPTIPVISGADRLLSAHAARGRGCDVVVLDDAFQHRRVARVVDIVLVAAAQWSARHRCLPRGPSREPAASLRRATLVLVTRKGDDATLAQHVREEVARRVRVPVVVASLDLLALHRVGADDTMHALASLHGARVLAVAGVGEPTAFARQLQAAGGEVTLASFPDHHAFSASDIAALVRRAAAMDLVVCTLKDAVKLESHWPRAATPLWYVSQRLTLADGGEALARELSRLLAARRHSGPTTAG